MFSATLHSRNGQAVQADLQKINDAIQWAESFDGDLVKVVVRTSDYIVLAVFLRDAINGEWYPAPL